MQWCWFQIFICCPLSLVSSRASGLLIGSEPREWRTTQPTTVRKPRCACVVVVGWPCVCAVRHPRFSCSDEPNQKTGGIAAHRSIIRPLPVLVFAPRAASLAGLPVCLDLPSSRKKTETTYIYYESQYVVDLALFSFFSFSSIKSVLFCFVLLCLVWFASK